MADTNGGMWRWVAGILGGIGVTVLVAHVSLVASHMQSIGHSVAIERIDRNAAAAARNSASISQIETRLQAIERSQERMLVLLEEIRKQR